MNLEGKNVLVTGAGGFIGSHLVERLAVLQNQVKCFVRYNSRNNWGYIEKFSEEIKDKLEIIPGDLKDGYFLRTVVKDVDVIFHLGAIIAIPYSYLHPKETFETNICSIQRGEYYFRRRIILKISEDKGNVLLFSILTHQYIY